MNIHDIGPHVLHAIPVVAVGLLILGLGLLIQKREGVSPVSLAFLYLTTTSAFWLMFIGLSFAVPAKFIYYAYRLEHLGVVFIPSALFVFTFCVAGRWKENRGLGVASVILSVLFYGVYLSTDKFQNGIYEYSWGPYPKYGIAAMGLCAYMAVAMVVCLWFCHREYRLSTIPSRKGRLKSFRNAFIWGFISAVDLVPTFGVDIYPFGFAAVFIFMVLAARAIWRYRLVDIKPGFASKQIMDTMSDALIVVDRDAMIRLVNKTAASVFKKTDEELLGKSIYEVCPAFVNAERFGQMLEGKPLEYETCLQSGRESDFYSIFTSLIRETGKENIDAVILIARNVSHRKKMEAQYRETQKMETIGALAGGMASDLLRQLKSLTESLETGNKEEGGRQLKRATETVEKILQLTEAKAFEKRSLFPGSLIGNLENWLSKFLPVTILTNVTWDKEVWKIQGNEAELESVLMNLISNAKESMPHGGRLILKAYNKYVSQSETKSGAAPGAYVVVSVRDTGCGMSEELCSLLSDSLFLMKRKGLEVGLGLPFVLNVMKDHKGWVDVNSQVGKGTTFDLYFPAETPISVAS